MEKMSATGSASSAPFSAPRSPWHSPVPYLFGGLAAMLGLIAFALLILACSYWKLSARLEASEESGRDVEAGADDDSAGDVKPPPVFEEKILVIMAGQAKPTYLATPMSSRASSFGSSTSSTSTDTISTDKSDNKDETSVVVVVVDDQLQLSNDMDNHESTTIQVP